MIRKILIYIASKLQPHREYPQLWTYTPPPDSSWKFLRKPLRYLCKIFISHEPSLTECEYSAKVNCAIRYCRWCNETLKHNIKEDVSANKLKNLLEDIEDKLPLK
jgi:hypothetical protein